MSGKVWLVGAGPGDPDLITVKGSECLKKAEVLVYDKLINSVFLTYPSSECILVNVGKESNHHPVPQEEINKILIQYAKEGKRVVRLKCGDPFVFGRGGEEVEALLDAGCDFEVVPGVTSAIGGLASAGIPITHRDHASSFHIVTGHSRSDKDNDPIDWQALAKLDGTLVILMGVGNLPNICHSLSTYGKSQETPVAIVMNASFPDQRVVTGTLSTIVEIAKTEKVKAPALIVFGEVVSLLNHPCLKGGAHG